MKIVFWCLVASIMATGTVYGQPPDHDRIARIDSIMNAHIVHEGRRPVHNFLLYARNEGNGLEVHLGAGTIGSSDTAIDAGYQYNVASITKTLVATIVLQLQEEGKFQLDDPVWEYIESGTPAVKPIHVLHDTDYSSRVTIRQLLQHTSGIADIFSDAATRFNISVWLHKNRQFDTRLIMERYYRYRLNRKPFNKPGQGYHYSDINYMLLGFLAEKVTGESLPALIRERILDPLGMKDTYFEFYEPEHGEGKRIDAYLNGINMTQRINTSYEWGGGGIVSTTRDMAVFIEALFANKLYRNPQTLNLMTDMSETKKFGANYGMGIFRYELGGKSFYGHGGFYGSVLAYDPADRITFSGNIGQANPPYDAGKLVESIMNILMKPAAPQTSRLWETEWTAERIGTLRADSSNSRPATLTLNRKEGRVQGSGPCNRFSGTMETDGKETLRFGSLLSTKMACGGLSTETAFFSALDNTVRFRLRGDILEFLDDEGRVLVTFRR